MRSKRSEYFRFEFDQPIDATIRIIEVNGTEKISKPAKAKIKDLSPHGMKLLTNLNFILEYIDSLKIEIDFSLNEDSPITATGSLVWQKEEFCGYSYGIKLESTEDGEKKIIEELKKFSKQTVYIKRKNSKAE